MIISGVRIAIAYLSGDYDLFFECLWTKDLELIRCEEETVVGMIILLVFPQL